MANFIGTPSDAANWMADRMTQALADPPASLPDPNLTGPCNLQASPFCDNRGRQRLDPMDMLDASTAFAGHVSACDHCYEVRADRYVAEVHGR